MQNFQLDPQAQALLDRARLAGAQPVSTLAPVLARQVYRDSRRPTQPPPRPVAVRDLVCPGPASALTVREYRPLQSEGTRLRALVFFHGGGWVIGDLSTHDVLCRDLCEQSGSAVFSVDYRLAPEHRFPAAFDDALAATRWLLDQSDALAIDPARITVGGDSAGGNLAATVALAMRDTANAKLAGQLLIYPVTDLRCASDSYQRHASGYVLSGADMHYFRQHYLGEPPADQEQRPALDWRASPLLAQDHRNLSPALVITAGFDPLHDEGRAYADQLAAAGNQVQYVDFSRQMHGFIGMGGIIDEANTAVRLAADWLRRLSP